MTSPYLTVAEDVEHLREEWPRDPSDAVIRRGSAILRRLLVEDVLGQAWRHHGFPKQPIIHATNLLDGANIRRHLDIVEFAAAGGAKVAGGIFGQTVLMREVSDFIAPTADPSVDYQAFPYPLTEFRASPALVVRGDVSRQDVVSYFANAMGGVHLHASSRTKKRGEELIARIQRIQARIQIGPKDGLYFELLSIGQAIGGSADVAALCERIRRNELR